MSRSQGSTRSSSRIIRFGDLIVAAFVASSLLMGVLLVA